MTVAELMGMLGQLPPELPVRFRTQEWGDSVEVDEASLGYYTQAFGEEPHLVIDPVRYSIEDARMSIWWIKGQGIRAVYKSMDILPEETPADFVARWKESRCR